MSSRFERMDLAVLRSADDPPRTGAALDLTPLAQRWEGPAPAREWLVDGWIPAGTVTSLYGDGGTGKSLLAMQLGTCMAIGGKFLGLPTQGGRVLGVFCEDDDQELWRRQEAINQAYNISMGDPEDRVIWHSRVGQDNLLATFLDEAICLSGFWYDLKATAAEYRPALIILDTAADIFGGNDLSTPQVRQFIQVALGGLARELGCTVLMLAHPSLSGKASGEGSHGSRAWNNAVRSRLYLEHDKPEDGEHSTTRTLSRKKANYSAHDETLRLFWDRGAFWPVLERGAEAEERKGKAEEAFLILLAERRAQNRIASASRSSPNHAPTEFSKASGINGHDFKFTRRDYMDAMERLLREGKIVNVHSNKLKTHTLELAEGVEN